MPHYVYKESNPPVLGTGKAGTAFTAVSSSGATLLIKLLTELEHRQLQRATKDSSTAGPIVEVRWGEVEDNKAVKSLTLEYKMYKSSKSSIISFSMFGQVTVIEDDVLAIIEASKGKH